MLLLLHASLPGLTTPPTKNWIPFLRRPLYLDETYAADVGFDPLKFVEREGPWWELAGAATAHRRVAWMREAEIKHSRIAMLAAAGWPLSELYHGPLAGAAGLPFGLDPTQGRAPSLLNGNLAESAPLLVLAVLFASYLECRTLDQVHGLTATGRTLRAGQPVELTYSPGDLGFDPLSLYDFWGRLMPPLVEARAAVDNEYRLDWLVYHRRVMEAAEIKNGRLAMLAITGYAFQEALWGVPVVDQTPILFTPLPELLFSGAW
mmetsp:Transcript_5703/g.16570  ORF Transcript_5703/g.16570 Transcript_5703/m.16570 type:complete len:262 (-) Transcript_5703:288-1073(-)